jgi:hypothetical protein
LLALEEVNWGGGDRETWRDKIKDKRQKIKDKSKK